MKASLYRFVLLGLLLWASSSSLAAQSLAQMAPAGGFHPYIAISPLKAMDPVNTGLLGAAGVTWSSGWAIEAGYLWLFPIDPAVENLREQRGKRYHVTTRYYFLRRPDTPLVPFLQLRGDLLRRTHQTTLTFLEEEVDGQLFIYEDSVGVDTRTQTLNLMVGVDWALTSHVAVEFSAGIGSRYRRVSYFDRIREGDPQYEQGGDFFDLRNDVGNFRTVNFPVDLRFIYRW